MGAFHTWAGVVDAAILVREEEEQRRSAAEAFQATRTAGDCVRGLASWRQFATAMMREAAASEEGEAKPAVPCLVQTGVLLPELKAIPEACSAAAAKVNLRCSA